MKIKLLIVMLFAAPIAVHAMETVPADGGALRQDSGQAAPTIAPAANSNLDVAVNVAESVDNALPAVLNEVAVAVPEVAPEVITLEHVMAKLKQFEPLLETKLIQHGYTARVVKGLRIAGDAVVGCLAVAIIVVGALAYEKVITL